MDPASYADCNDAARLEHDPIHKLMVGQDPLTGLGLASQPTLSRFENAVTARELRAMTHVLADTVIAQQRRRLHGRATRFTLDLDPTDVTPPTASKSSRSPMGKTTRGAICRSSPR